MVMCIMYWFAAYYGYQQPGQSFQAPPRSQLVAAQGTFDQGARFDPNKPVTIPVSELS